MSIRSGTRQCPAAVPVQRLDLGTGKPDIRTAPIRNAHCTVRIKILHRSNDWTGLSYHDMCSPDMITAYPPRSMSSVIKIIPEDQAAIMSHQPLRHSNAFFKHALYAFHRVLLTGVCCSIL